MITRKGDSNCEARYYAAYDWCLFGFTFEYTVPMSAELEGKSWKFRGSAELGCWIGGGLYEYEGTAGGGEYRATYRSSDDHGIFRMKRVK